MNKIKLRIIFVFLFIISIYNVIGTSCTCGSYPCSTAQCSSSLSYCVGSCGSADHWEYTGTCEADGLGGSCEIIQDSCSANCDDSSGCFGNCCSSGDCPSDSYYCVGSVVYYKDYSCAFLSYVCEYDVDFVENCDDDDGDVCISRDIYTKDYGCSSGNCYEVSSSFKTDCGYLDTSFGSYYCSNSVTSSRQRDLGACEMSPIQCYAEEITESETCDYGCSSSFFETEFQFKCLGSDYYYLQDRGVYGMCRVEGHETWTNSGSQRNCEFFCDSTLDEVVNTYSSNLNSPCGLFDIVVESNPSTPYLLTGETLEFRVTDAGTYDPYIVCYDELNDGVYDYCYGSTCDSNTQNDYCGGLGCCVGGSVFNDWHTFSDTSSLLDEYINIIGIRDDWESEQIINYKITSGYIDSEILPTGLDDDIDNNYIVTTGQSFILSSASSIGVPSLKVACWDYLDDNKECYGLVGDCSTYCSGHDWEGDVILSNYELTKTEGSGLITLKVCNVDGCTADTQTVCFSHYANDFYCGTCNDNIQNDDEIDVDLGGHCGSCFDNVTNGGESYIDYGGRCGTCFDNKRQVFELLDVDYGGICGNCIENKEQDNYWILGHSTDKTIPFNYDYCGDTSNAILMTLIYTVVFLFGGFLILSLIVLFALVIAGVNLFGLFAFATNYLFKKRKK